MGLSGEGRGTERKSSLLPTCWVQPRSGSSVPAGQSTSGRQRCGTAEPFLHICPGGHTCITLRSILMVAARAQLCTCVLLALR